jgi:alpha-glucosidase (family GH31 glycosyl hydrolase)
MGLRFVAGAFAVVLVGAAPARADVEIGAERIVVSAPGARAVVDRAPFRLAFAGRAGDPVLRQVPNERTAPVIRPPELDQEPLGADIVAETALYQPFVFEVGGSLNPQYPGATWIGNLVVSARAGSIFAARDVVDVQPEGAGARLTLSTSDPAGRQVVVTVVPEGKDAIRVRANVVPDAGVSALGDAFQTRPGESFFGFGGRHNAIDQRGQELLGFILEQGVGAGSLQPVADAVPGTQGERYIFPNGPTMAFYPQNLMYSSAGYGLLVARDELTRWRMASDREDAWSVAVDGAALDYVVAPGTGPAAVAAITRLNGRHRVPPEASMGSTISRTVQVLSSGADDATSYEAKVRADIAKMDQLQVFPDVYGFEGWAILPRATTKALIDALHRRGIEAQLYLRCYTAADAASTEPASTFTTALQNGYLTRTAAGTPYLFGSTFIAGVAGLIDFTNPAAVTWWKGRVEEMLDLGADSFMQDFGEQVLLDMTFADGSTGREMHNRYPVIYHRVTRAIVDDWERRHPERGPVFFFTRTGFSGTPGAAAVEQSNFPGDETTDWSRSTGLASLATDMLSRAVGGAYGFNTDIGGYLDVNTPRTSQELFVRWSQWAALTPFFRVHNSASTGVRHPWSWDAATLGLWRAAADLHREALPAIRKLWTQAQKDGTPPTRPLWLAYPSETEARKQDQEWLLGPDVLVAPVVTEGATTRRVWFPPGCWEHGETGERRQGPGYETVPAPLASLPWFKRCGTTPFAAGPGRGLPGAKRCRSRKPFTIVLDRRLRKATVTVAGRRVRVVRRGGRLRARIRLRGKAGHSVRIVIRGRTRSGRVLSAARSYRICR